MNTQNPPPGSDHPSVKFLPARLAPVIPISVSGGATGAAGERVSVEGHFALSGDAMKSAFAKTRIYPVSLAAASVYDGALQLFLQWLDLIGAGVKGFAAANAPWLPIGKVGPVLVLGHCQPENAAPLPRGWFQPVLLRRAEYERHHRFCAPLIAAADRPDWEEFAAPKREFPGLDAKLIKPRTVRAALRFLLEYFPHSRADLERVQQMLVESDEVDMQNLPAGYAGACRVLLEEGGVADATVIAAPEAIVARVPAAIAGRVRVISEYARNVWIAMEKLPQHDVEDMLLNELGDGWNVHTLLLDGLRYLDKSAAQEAHSSSRSADAADQRGGRTRVKIEDARARVRGGEDTPKPGVIRMSAKDIRELETYNARRADRDPAKVFLKELSAGIQAGATDLHIEMGLDCYRIRARIDGWLEEWLEMPTEFGRMLTGAAKEMFGMPPERFEPQDGNCTVFHGSDVVNLRVSAYPIRGIGQKVAIRYLPRRGSVPTLDEIMPEKEARLMRRAITRPYGLIFLCGPTGSGKTTTAASALSEVNTPDVNITTMEDPVEYEMDRANQAELDRPRGVDWTVLLEGFLRQDPDIGAIGEIRDRATAETAIRLTLTGHIVFATMHTMSCAHTVERLVDMGVNASMFANAATLIVSQRLLRRLCKRCKSSGTGRRPLTEPEKRLFERHDVGAPEWVYDAKPGECTECRNTGYRGQVAAVEMLPITEEVKQLIEEKRSVREIEQWMKAHSFSRVYQAALALVAKGETTMAEANYWQAVWEDIGDLMSAVPRRGVDSDCVQTIS